jgi:ABC-2 type transport system permease protein
MGIGFRTLMWKEIRRFLRVPGQTLAQPVVMTSLYFLVFGFALGGRVRELDGVPYAQFIVPGLIMLGVIQNAFLNTSSSMFILKVQGTIVDLLVAPLSSAEILGAFVLGGMARGLLVGAIVWGVSGVFVGFSVVHPLWTLLFAVLVAAIFSLLGLIVAIWSEKFEHLNIVPTFILTPLTFLGGVFYSVSMLPAPWSTITRVNPILYMVEGLRYGLLGVSGTPPLLGLALCAGLTIVCFVLSYWMLATGYRLRK